MTNRYQPEESQQTIIRVSITITYPMAPVRDNDEYFEQRRSESSEIVDVLKKLEATDYKFQNCMVVTGEPDKNTSKTTRRSSSLSFQSALLPSQWVEVGQSIIQITAQVSRNISENKDTVYISAALATIYGEVVLPLAKAVLKLLHKEKKRHESEMMSSVTVGVGKQFIKVEGLNQKKNEETVTRLSDSFFKEHSEALPNGRVVIKGKLTNSPSRSRRKPHKKRSN